MHDHETLSYDKPSLPMSEFRLRCYTSDQHGKKIDPFEVRLVQDHKELHEWRMQFFFKWPSPLFTEVHIIHNQDTFNKTEPKKIITISKIDFDRTNSLILYDIPENDFNGAGEIVFLPNSGKEVRYFYNIDFLRRMPLRYQLRSTIFDDIKHRNILISSYVYLKKKMFTNHKTLIITYPKIKSDMLFRINNSHETETLDASKHMFKKRIKLSTDDYITLSFVDENNDDFYYFKNVTSHLRKKMIHKSRKKMTGHICPYCLQDMIPMKRSTFRTQMAYNVHDATDIIKLQGVSKKENKSNNAHYCIGNLKGRELKRVIPKSYFFLPTIRIFMAGFSSSGKSVNLSRLFGLLNYSRDRNTRMMTNIGHLMIKQGISIPIQTYQEVSGIDINSDASTKRYFDTNYMFNENRELLGITERSEQGVYPPFIAQFGKKFNFHAYDVAGEDLTDISGSRKNFISILIQNSNAVFWHIDTATAATYRPDMIKTAFTNYQDTYQSIKNMNFAILWTKYDVEANNLSIHSALNNIDIYDLMKKAKGHYQGSDLQKLIENTSREVEEEIKKAPDGIELINTLKENTKGHGQICFFNVSALGHHHFDKNKLLFEAQPIRLELPLIWLLGQLGYL